MTSGSVGDAVRYRAVLFCPSAVPAADPVERAASEANSRAMAAFLGDPTWGVCDRSHIEPLSIEPTAEVRARLRTWFASATPDDVLIFYYSGRGVGARGRTQLATAMADDHLGGGELDDWIGQSDASMVYVIVDADGAHVERLFVDAPGVIVIGSGDALVAADGAGPSAFTTTLTDTLTSIRNPSGRDVARALELAAERTDVVDGSGPIVRVPPNRDLSDAPLRRVEPRLTPRSDGSLWATAAFLAVFVLVVIGVFSTRSSSDDGATSTSPLPAPPPSSTTGTVDVAAAPLTSAPATDDGTVATGSLSAPVPTEAPSVSPASETTVFVTTTAAPAPTGVPLASLSEADLGVSGATIADPECEGDWVAQIGATAATGQQAATAVSRALETPGASYTYTPGSCPTFNQTQDFYVVYLGPFPSADDARAACAGYVSADPDGGRQCFPVELG